MKKYFLYAALFFLSSVQAQLIVNNTTFTPIQLVQNSLVGAGVTPYNIIFNGVPGTVIRDQIAKFTTNFNPTNLGLSTGLLLSTGNAQLAIGPNNSANRSLVTTTPTQGDVDLALLCGQNVRNVSVVEFDFVATGSALNFDYVFASEEYPEFANTAFNDTFGFFLRGPGITGIYSGNAQNIALIPTSPTLPITINNVNNGTANNGPCEYCTYYVNNGTGTTPAANPSIQYDGFTTPLRAYSPLQCGQVYHIKLAVGNVSDNAYDSAVFLKNFTIQPLELQVTDLSGTPSIPLCFGTINSINSGLSASGTNVYQWNFEGVPVPGETTPNFPAIPASPPVALTPGTYTLNVYTPTGCLLATDDITISYRPEAPIQDPLDITLCTAAAPPYLVNIDQTSTILGALDPDLYEVSFYNTNLADAMLGGVTGLIPFANWSSYNITAVPTTIWATVLDLVTDCKTVRPFEINVTPTPSGTISFPQLVYCSDVTTTPITTNVTPGGIYSATPPGLTIDPATGAINPSTSTPNNYTVHYDLAASGTCPAYSAPTIPLTVALISATPTITVVQPSCTVTTGSITVTAPLGIDLEYSMDNGVTYQTSPVFDAVPSGYNYQIVVRNTTSNCASAALAGTMNPVLGVPLPATASVTVQPDCVMPTGTIVVSSPTGANVEYSINGGTSYQSSATFAGLTPNVTYNISVRDVNTGCLSAATPFTINPLPPSPAPPAGNITQPTCFVPTATIALTSPIGADLEYSIDGGTTFLPWVNFPWLTPNATYSISVRNTTTSCISPTAVFVVNAIPANPTAPAGTLVQPTCSVTTGSYVITSPQGTDLQYSLDGGTTYQSGLSFPTLTANTTYLLTAYNSLTGCTSAATTVNINPVLAVPASATASTTVQPICTVPTGTIVVTAPLGTDLEYSTNGGITYQTSATFTGLAPNASYSIVVRNTVSGCTSAPVLVSVDPLPAGPVAPTASVTVQPDCVTPTGTIVVSSPTGANVEYSINGGTSYQASATFAGLTPNVTYNIGVRDMVTRCISSATAVLVSPIPANPLAPLGSITQPICANPTGTIVLTSPLGATFEYSIDGGTTYQTGVTFVGLAPNATYSIRVRNTVSGCVSLGSNFAVIPAPNVPATPLASVTVACVGESVYFTTPTVPGATYSWTGPDGYGSTFQNPVIVSAQMNAIGMYQVVVALTPDCPSLPGSVALSVNPLPLVQITGGAICVDGAGAVLSPLQLDTTLSTTDFTFQWFTIANNSATLIPGSAPTYLASIPGEYGVVVTDLISGCVSTLASAEVTLMPKPESLVLETSAYFSDAQVIYAYVMPLGNYEYQLDGGNFQSSNVFGGIATGTHTVTVRDLNQCGELSETVELLNFPRFFTPNNDTYNDTWNIFDLRNQANAKIYIFDRLGKLLKQLSPADSGWDGSFNNRDLPASDYWFVVYYKEKNEDKIFKSHFALKR